MILFKNEIKEKKALSYNEKFLINKDDLEVCNDILEVENIDVKLDAQYVSDLVICKLTVNAELILRSTRTLKPVPYIISDEDEITLAFDHVDYDLGDEIIDVKDDRYDFYKDIYSMIATNIPLKIIGKDDPNHQQGENWEVLSEEEYYRRKKEEIDPRMAQFANIDLDEE